MVFDRVHRVGTASNNKVRPIVAKFHYFREKSSGRLRTITLKYLKGQILELGYNGPNRFERHGSHYTQSCNRRGTKEIP